MSETRKIIDNIFKSKVISHDLIKSAQLLLNEKNNKIVHEFLELGHLPLVNNEILKENKVDQWLELIIDLIKKSNYNIYTLFKIFLDKINNYINFIIFSYIIIFLWN